MVKNDSEFILLVTSTKLGQIGFTECEGGDLERSVEEYPDPLQDRSGYNTGTAKYTPLTLRVPYDPTKHDNFLVNLKNFCVGEGDDIQCSVQPIKICPETTLDGKARVYIGCIPSRVKFAGAKRGTAGTSMIEVVLNPSDMKFA